MVKETVERTDPGFCLYGAQRLLSKTGDLAAEIEGVKAAEDIEYVHRMRVASRRIRATLPLFSGCFPKKKYNVWRIEIRGVTRALGSARDADVQIDFLIKFLDSLPASQGGAGEGIFLPEGSTDQDTLPVSVKPTDEDTVGARWIIRLQHALAIAKKVFLQGGEWHEPKPETFTVPEGAPLRPGLECLILRLRQKRDKLQPAVIETLEHLESSGVIGDIEQECRKMMVSARLHHTDIHSKQSFSQAFFQISLCTENLFSHEPFVGMEDQISQHHQMRIAAKKLRYTMEIFRDLYDEGLKKPIKAVKKLQDLLGDMHDCDVWVDFLPGFIEEERAAAQQYFGHTAFFGVIEPGLLYLRRERKERRHVLYQEFVSSWKQLQNDGLWDELQAVISTPLQNTDTGIIHGIEGCSAGHTPRIALIGDVHANMPALDAVLNDARRRGATAILNIGDFVGYGPNPDEVITRMREEHVISTIGNYDLNVLKYIKGKKKGPKNKEKQIALKWAAKNITKINRSYLRSLPGEIRLTIAGRRILLTHGSPESLTEYITAETQKKRLSELAAIARADIVVTGHSHRACVLEHGDVWFVNTGSVGRPGDADPRAVYALLQFDPFQVSILRIPYDIDAVVADIKRKGLPASFGEMFRYGVDLENVQITRESATKNQAQPFTISCETFGEGGRIT